MKFTHMHVGEKWFYYNNNLSQNKNQQGRKCCGPQNQAHFERPPFCCCSWYCYVFVDVSAWMVTVSLGVGLLVLAVVGGGSACVCEYRWEQCISLIAVLLKKMLPNMQCSHNSWTQRVFKKERSYFQHRNCMDFGGGAGERSVRHIRGRNPYFLAILEVRNPYMGSGGLEHWYGFAQEATITFKADVIVLSVILMFRLVFSFAKSSDLQHLLPTVASVLNLVSKTLGDKVARSNRFYIIIVYSHTRQFAYLYLSLYIKEQRLSFV